MMSTIAAMKVLAWPAARDSLAPLFSVKDAFRALAGVVVSHE
jgi:hypothetical protein